MIFDLHDAVAAVWDWAWARHGNQLSWYIRPLFLIPLALAAYRRSWWGIVVTLIALLTSMAWFPAPDTPSPQVQEFLAFEQDFLLGAWPAPKIALSLLVPLSLAAYCAAFWYRSLRWGLVVLLGMALAKVAWSVTAGGTSGTATIVPAAAGLLVGAVVIAIALRWWPAVRTREHRRSGETRPRPSR